MGTQCCTESKEADHESELYQQVTEKAQGAIEGAVPSTPRDPNGAGKLASFGPKIGSGLSLPHLLEERIPTYVMQCIKNMKVTDHMEESETANTVQEITMIKKDEQEMFCGQLNSSKRFEGRGYHLRGNVLDVGTWKDGKRTGTGQRIVWKTNKKIPAKESAKPKSATSEESDEEAIYVGVYSGNWRGEEMEGVGQLVTNRGYSYKGYFIGDLQEGYGDEAWTDGSIYRGDYRKGLKEGHGEFIWGNKSRYVGQFKNDLMDGFGTFEWSDGSRYVGYWKKNEMHGMGKYTWSDGMVYEGEYKWNKKDGFGVLTMTDQFRWEGQWKNGKKEGKGVLFSASGERVSGLWINDKKKSL